MKTITIDILNERAINLLRELEALNLIKILKREVKPPLKENSTVKKKASDYKGIIPSEVGEKMQEHVKQSREEWKGRI
jgi:hypothetical protein